MVISTLGSILFVNVRLISDIFLY